MALVNGVDTIDFGRGVCARASGAYSPDDGKLYRTNKPRITPGRFARNTWEPKVFHTFSAGETKMEYDTTDNQLLLRQATFESEFPEFTRVNLGFSHQARSIFGYRLGPTNRKHFVQVNAVHGNEIDGVNGAFKAMEILAREAEFQPFRDEYTIFFVPALNPDGWKLGTRNLAQVGPNGLTINLNRNWDWFWDEYVETANESKGATAESTAEAQALLTYLRTANGGGAVPKGFMLDFHANQGTGARYQSRDRIWREITDPDYGTVNIPEGRLTQYIDWYVWRTAMTLATKRQRENGGPELWVRYLRSRFRPHMHSYHSSIGWASIAVEELKVDDANGFETYQHACNYRLDYILTAAQMVTAINWEFDDALLLEKAGRNIHNNSEFEQWQAGDERPGNWTTSRTEITRHTHIPEQREAPAATRLYDHGGSGLEITSDIDLTLAATEEFTGAASARVGECGFLLPNARNWYRFILLEDHNAGEMFGSPMTRTSLFRAGVANSGDGTVDIIGGGTAAPSTGAVATVTRLDHDAETETNLTGVLNTARMAHGCADNFLDLPTTFSSRLAWVFGGFNSGGTRLTSIEEWDPNAAAGQGVATTLAAALPVALAECVAVHDPVSNHVFIFGGSTSVAGAVDTIYDYDVTGDSISTHTAVLPTALKNIATAYVPFNNRIYLFGGEDAAGDMQSEVYVFNPADSSAGAIVQEDTRQNLGDDEDLEVPGGESGPWVTLIGRWAGTTLLENSGDGTGAVYLVGGRLTNSAGALLDTIYRYDPPDMTIGLPRESDYGYFRWSVSSVDRRYAYKLEVTATLSTDFFRRNDDIDFSSGAIDNDVMEYVAQADLAARGLRLDASDVDGQADIRPGNTFTGPRGTGTVVRVPYDNFPSLDETNMWEDPAAAWEGGTALAQATDQGPLILRCLPDFVNQKLQFGVTKSGDGTLEFGAVCRGTYDGSTLTDGYRVVFAESTNIWRVERVYSSTFQASLTSVNSGPYDLDGIDSGNDVDLDVTVDGVGPTTVTFSDSDPLITNFAAVTAEEVAAVISAALSGSATATAVNGQVILTSDTVGATSALDVDAGSPDANSVIGFPTTAVANAPEVLGTLDVTADATRQLINSARTLVFRVEDLDPVHLVVTFNSLSILNVFDLSEHRIKVTGKVAVEGDS